MRPAFRILFLPFILLWVIPAVAQQAVLSNGKRLTGTILDGATKQTLPFTSVAVWKSTGGKGSLLTGSQANEQGAFMIITLPMGTFHIRVSFVGYQNLDQLIRVSEAETTLGTLALKASASTLNEVKVTGEKSANSMTMEKRTFNYRITAVTVNQGHPYL